MEQAGAALSMPTRIRKPRVVVQPVQRWGQLGLRELWESRELLWVLTTRDIKGRYRQSAFGWLWILIRPLVQVVVFSTIFGRVAKLPSEGLPYAVFTYVGILPWAYFSASAGNAAGSLVSRLNILSKVYFSRLVPPVSAVLSGLLDLAVSAILLLLTMAYYGFFPPIQALFIPLYLLLAMSTALAIGLWTATLTVQFRDVRFGIETALQVWMYATPVAYSAGLVPERWQTLYKLNPLYWVVEGFRWGLLGRGEPPQMFMLWPVLGVLVLLVSGALVFRRTARSIVDLQ